MISYPPEIDLEHASCPLGCHAGDEEILVGCDRIHHLPGKYPVVKCRGCGLLRTNPRPTIGTIGYYYPDDYRPHRESSDAASKVMATNLRKKEKPFPPLFQWNNERIPHSPPGRLLEIGCASGGFLHRMVRQGWIAEGVELSANAAEAARRLGHEVFQGPFEEMPEKNDTYDLIVGWMVLEHLHNPVHCLQKMHRLTKLDGNLVISVPNAGSLEFRLFKERWYALQLPVHLFHFTPLTLQSVLEKGGWRIQRIFHQRVLSNLVASIGYVLKDRSRMNRVADALLDFPKMSGIAHHLVYPFAYLLSLFGQTGRMTVWARRQND